MYVTIEGIDGCGKTTLIENLKEQSGYKPIRDALFVKEPGSTPLADKLREIIIARSTSVNEDVMQCLLQACIIDNIESNIIPALSEDRMVISDRGHLSTLAYCNGELEDRINLLSFRQILPTLTILLSIDPLTARNRKEASGGEITRYDEAEFEVYHKRSEIYHNCHENWKEQGVPVVKIQTDQLSPLEVMEIARDLIVSFHAGNRLWKSLEASKWTR